MEYKIIEVRARCSKVERLALDRLAEHYGMKPGEWVRAMIRDEAKQLGLWPVGQAENIPHS